MKWASAAETRRFA